MMTDPTPDRHHPVEGQDPETVLAAHAATLQPPAWADAALYSHDLGREGAVAYRWTAPMPDVVSNELEGGQLEVQAVQHRLLTLQPDGEVLAEDQGPSVHCEAGDLRLSPDDARALAAALVACADRVSTLSAAEGPHWTSTPAADGVGSADPITIAVVPDLRGSFAWWEEERHLAIRQGDRVETVAALRAAADRLDGVA